MEDNRPDPKPRKYAHLWQAYLAWNEHLKIRTAHSNRISSIKRGKSNLDLGFELALLDAIDLDRRVEACRDLMIDCSQDLGAVWAWGTSIKGLGAGGLLAQLLAQVDDIAAFVTVSKLWRFCGWAVIDGQVDRCQKGETAPYNRKLKAICWNIVKGFIIQQTPVYADAYYDEKERQRRLHPETLCRECQIPWDQCQQKRSHHKIFNDGHLHNRAIRKVAKLFLQHLWLVWRSYEGLPVTKPYIHAIGGHDHYIPPPNFPLEDYPLPVVATQDQ